MSKMSEEGAYRAVERDRFDAVLFDMDGVLTTTRRLHAAAWKRTFDEFLAKWDSEHGSHTDRFSIAEDYPRSVDGKPREEGVRDFLASRGIHLPPGACDSPPSEWSVYGIGNRKQDFIEEALRDEGVEVFPGSVAWLRQLRGFGLKTAVVTSSRNAGAVLDAAGITELFDVQVDGNTALELQLSGKPSPDTFLEAARRLGVDPPRAVVVEDSRAGVEASRAAGIGLTIGVDRTGGAEDLRRAGADIVVADLCELVIPGKDLRHPVGPRGHRLRAGAVRLLAAGDGFPIDEHRLIERQFTPGYTPQLESIFALSNGYLGLRGTQDEGRPVHDPAPLLNGFYETWPIVYPESSHGFAETGQTMVGVPDGAIIRLYVDDEPFVLDQADILEYERVLDMRTGTLERRVLWRATDGSRFIIRSRRLVSFVDRHLACLEYEVTSLDRLAQVTISSDLVLHAGAVPFDEDDPRCGRMLDEGVLEKIREVSTEQQVILAYQTQSSGLQMACGIDHQMMNAEPGQLPHISVKADWARVVYRVQANEGEPIRLVKYLAYHHDDAELAEELCFRAKDTLERAMNRGFDGILEDQRSALEDFWSRSDVVTEGAPLLQQAVRFNLFQLLQASARVEGYGIPAKGLTGRGYDGHYFWDSEIYVMPFLTYTAPQVAKSLLRHRYAMLDKARERALQLDERGALFPWRTISGEEASAFYLAGTAQYHINADIAYALAQYVRATDDEDFLARQGVEILVETARLWASLGFFSDAKEGRFVINGVTGPDEYSALVDNNTFTNLMAKENLNQAAQAVEWLRETDADAYARLIERTGLEESEPSLWRRAADLMYVPYDSARRLYLQDEGFLNLEPWDFENTPVENYPLMLHYHPLVIYRHQVIKQADVVLATFLLRDAFTDEERWNVLEYYDPLTTTDSSLSECIQSIMAARTGNDLRAAEEYFVDAASIDLADVAGNVRDGVHVAATGGTWMALVYGFAGMSDEDGELSFRPRLPARMRRLSFKIQFRGSTLKVDITKTGATYQVESGKTLTATHEGERLTLEPGKPASRLLAAGRA